VGRHIVPYDVEDIEGHVEGVTGWSVDDTWRQESDPQIERTLRSLAEARPGWISQRPFNEELSELGEAGSDFLLMPSRYEPCGLPQMECPRFGTLPVARLTGGIRDTVIELDTEAGTGNGFTFQEFRSAALELAIDKALAFYRLPEGIRIPHLQRIMQQSFDCFSLANTAAEYIGVYERLIQNLPG
jgi:starch synthase/alpha-amylase